MSGLGALGGWGMSVMAAARRAALSKDPKDQERLDDWLGEGATEQIQQSLARTGNYAASVKLGQIDQLTPSLLLQAVQLMNRDRMRALAQQRGIRTGSQGLLTAPSTHRKTLLGQ